MDIPDFAHLYPEDADVPAAVAAHVWSELQSWVDLPEAYEFDVDDLRLAAQSRLPSCARSAAEDNEWLHRFIQCFEDLSLRFAEGSASSSVCRCPGEEIALHLAIDDLRNRVQNETERWPPLAPYDIDEAAVDDAEYDLFQDHDVLLLFNPNIDPDDIGSLLPDTADLHPANWFAGAEAPD